jgi:hypothetical protein
MARTQGIGGGRSWTVKGVNNKGVKHVVVGLERPGEGRAKSYKQRVELAFTEEQVDQFIKQILMECTRLFSPYNEKSTGD